MLGTYRPTVQDMTDDSRWQQLSCREGGKFDYGRPWNKVKQAKAKLDAHRAQEEAK